MDDLLLLIGLVTRDVFVVSQGEEDKGHFPECPDLLNLPDFGVPQFAEWLDVLEHMMTLSEPK